MPSVRIEEFADAHVGPSGAVAAAQFPVIAFQQVAIGAGSVQSATFNDATRFVRVQAEALAAIDIAANPTATIGKLRMTAGQTEYYGVPPGWKLACITTT